MIFDYDVVIIGAGGAGMAAGIYTTRYDLKTVIFTKDIGGQAATTESIENYPGFEHIGGMELMQKFQQHAEKTGAEFRYEWVRVVSVLIPPRLPVGDPPPSKGGDTSPQPSSLDQLGTGSYKGEGADDAFPLLTKEGPGGGFRIVTDAGEYTAKTVIIAAGMEHRKLGVPGEHEFEGRGVAYCATCDAPLFRNKITAVVGGGNSGLEAAEILARIGKKVYVIVRDDAYKGEAMLIKTVMESSAVEKLFNSEIVEIKGNQKVGAVVVKNRQTEETQEIAVDGVFVQIGWQAKTEWLGDLVERNQWGEIIVSDKMETKTSGLYAAGDITNIFTKQLVASAGQGVLAAIRAIQFIREGK